MNSIRSIPIHLPTQPSLKLGHHILSPPSHHFLFVDRKGAIIGRLWSSHRHQHQQCQHCYHIGTRWQYWLFDASGFVGSVSILRRCVTGCRYRHIHPIPVPRWCSQRTSTSRPEIPFIISTVGRAIGGSRTYPPDGHRGRTHTVLQTHNLGCTDVHTGHIIDRCSCGD